MVAQKRFCNAVAEQLAAQVRIGTAPWQAAWSPGDSGRVPVNPSNGFSYGGVNAVWLMSQRRGDPRWLTAAQAEALGVSVAQGEQPTAIAHWRKHVERDKRSEDGAVVIRNGKPVRERVPLERPELSYVAVYNAEQIDGLPPLEPTKERADALTRAEEFLKASGVRVVHEDRVAPSYDVDTDTLQMPARSQYPSAVAYYQAVVHELVHATGHASRLDRGIGHPPGSASYAREELRAQIASMLIGEAIGIGYDPTRNAGYSEAWAELLEDSPLEIFEASAQASHMEDFVLSLGKGSAQRRGPVLKAKVPAIPTAKQGVVLEVRVFREKDDVKQLGARWDRDRRVWVVPAGADLEPFAKWLPAKQAVAPDVVEPALAVPSVANGSATAASSGPVPEAVESAVFEIETAERVKVLGPGAFAGSVRVQDREGFVHEVAERWLIREEGLDVGRSESLVMDVGELVTLLGPGEVEEARRIQLATGELCVVSRRLLDSGQEAAREQTRREWAQEENWKSQEPVRKQAGGRLGALVGRAAAMSWRLTAEGRKAGKTRRELVEQREVEREAELATDDPDEESEEAEVGEAVETKQLSQDGPVQSYAFTHGGESVRMHGAGFAEGTYRIEGADGVVREVPRKDVEVQGQSVGEVTREPRRPISSLPPPAPMPTKTNVRRRSKARNPVQAYSFTHEGEPVHLRGPGATDGSYQVEGTDGVMREVPLGEVKVLARAVGSAEPQEYAVVEDSGLTAVREASVEDKPIDLDDVPMVDIVLLDLPTGVRAEAKQLGVVYQPQLKAYYAPPHVSAPNVDRLTKLATAHRTVQCMSLAVRFDEATEVKHAGAWFDKTSKCWFGRPGADTQPLMKWAGQEAQQVAQVPNVDPKAEFGEVLRSKGFILEDKGVVHPIMDGLKHRCPLEGDKGNAKGGFYVGFLQGICPAGTYENHRTGDKGNWKAKGYFLDPEAKARLKVEANRTRQVQKGAQRAKFEATATRLRASLDTLKPVSSPTPYMQRKGLEIHKGAFADDKGTVCLPVADATGKLWSMEYIAADGTKRGAKDSYKEGCFHVVGGVRELSTAPAIVIAEGFSTASTLCSALGHPVVAALGAGNLASVAKSLHAKYPEKPVVIAGDDDIALERNPKIGVNRGREASLAAAAAVGGKAVFPIFAPKEQDAEPGRFKDFNDLAMNSVYANKGVETQFGSVMREVLRAPSLGKSVKQERTQTLSHGASRGR